MISLVHHTPVRLKLLLADDSAPFRRLVKTLFPVATTEFIECTEGAEAIRVYAAQRPDWVLMDIEMNGMDGLTATARIKARHPGARILIVTQYDDPDLRAKAQKAGAHAYILKDNLVTVRQFICEHQGSTVSSLQPVDPTPLRERNL